MMSIKASIRDHDCRYHEKRAGQLGDETEAPNLFDGSALKSHPQMKWRRGVAYDCTSRRK